MSRFLLLDNSLCGLGGHHYQYARETLSAAAALGYKTALAAHRDFTCAHDLELDRPVLPLFRRKGYSEHALCYGGGVDGALDLDGRPLQPPCEDGPPCAGDRTDAASGTFWARLRARLKGAWGRRWRQARRARYLNDYVGSLGDCFNALGIYPDDEIFLATSSDFDLLGLVRFLKSDPRTIAAHWRFLFHFSLLEGRAHEHAAQQRRVELARRQFQHALEQVPGHRLRFYCTTAELAAQYNLLGVGTFTPLPYPTGEAFAPLVRARAAEAPRQIVLAGHLRREKGKRELRRLVELIDARPNARQLHINLQTDRAPRWLNGRGADRAQVRAMPHPLASDAYARLIRESDVGLLLYDSRRYAARCSGILAELLSSGVPVIVPSGCWLATQIHGANQAWLAEVAARHADAETHYVTNLVEDFAVKMPCGVGQVLVELEAGQPVESAQPCYAGVEAQFVRKDGRIVDTRRYVVELDRPRVRLIADRTVGASSIRWKLKGIYGAPLPCFASASLRLLPERLQGNEPHGTLGAAVADWDQVPDALDEIVRNYDHYRRQALAHSTAWRLQCDPQHVVRCLLARSPTSPPAQSPTPNSVKSGEKVGGMGAPSSAIRNAA